MLSIYVTQRSDLFCGYHNRIWQASLLKYGAQSLFWVYALIFILALMGLAAMFLFPGGRPEQYAYKAEAKDGAESQAANIEPEIMTLG